LDDVDNNYHNNDDNGDVNGDYDSLMRVAVLTIFPSDEASIDD